jgi:O-antigen/teichoic acid export membrane protein
MSGPPAETRGTSLRRVLGRQLVWVTAGRLVAALLQAVLLVLAARALPVVDFGHLMAFVGVLTLVQVTVDCGVQTYISRERAATPDSGGVATALRFTVYSSLFMTVLLAAGLLAVGAAIDPVYFSMLPLALWGAGERSADMRLAVAFADGDVHVPTLHLVVRRLLTIVLFVGAGAVTALPDDPVLAFSVASAIAAAGSAFLANTYIRRRMHVPSSITFAELLRQARPYWVSNIALQARNLDAVVVSSFSGAGQAGLYSSGSRLVNPLQILPLSLAAILLPAAARSETTRASLVRLVRLTVLVVAALCVVYAGIFAVTPTLVTEGLGERYDGSVDVIRIILLGLPFSSAAAMFSAILQGRGEGHAVAVATTASTLGCLVGIAVVTPAAGAAGAAAVLSASFALQLVGMSVSMRRLWASSDA